MKKKLLLFVSVILMLMVSACGKDAVMHDNPVLQNIAEITCPDEQTQEFRDFMLKDIDRLIEKKAAMESDIAIIDAEELYKKENLKDAYVIDMDNDDNQELILIFQYGGDTMGVTLEMTEDGIKEKTDVPLYAYGGGMMGRWFSRLIKGEDNKIYLFEYSYGHTSDDNIKSGIGYTLTIFNSEEKTTLFDRYFYQETIIDNENKTTYEVDSQMVSKSEYEKEFDQVTEYLERFESCIDMEKFLDNVSPSDEFRHGEDFLKFA